MPATVASSMRRKSIPSIVTDPLDGSRSRETSDASVDFPEPVSPTSAKLVPAGTVTVTPSTAGAALSACRKVTFENATSPRTRSRSSVTGATGAGTSVTRSR